MSEDGINEFMDELNREYLYEGIFISAIINDLYKEDEIHLNSDVFNCFGCYNKDKKIVIEGDC
ncbi:MAG: hypothetical protein KAU95_03210, partial [Candidatus Aenigmarchaeota archaeon]|nr:hypothetical protein [Candidatus Aenigmarchaeota archaeon]